MFEEFEAADETIKPLYSISVPIQFIVFDETCISTLKKAYPKSAGILHYPRHCRTVFQAPISQEIGKVRTIGSP
jgi:hypothetical protein